MSFPQSLLKFATIFPLAAAATLFAAETDPASAVKRELDTNGLFLNYMDFEGGWKKVAQDVQLALKDTPWGNKDFVALAEASGLSQIRALGMSSTSLKSGYDNRIFVFTPGGRKGLLAIFPGEPAAFDGARLAPADTDLFVELRLDVPAVVGAVTQIAASVSGNKEMTAMALDMLRKDPVGYGTLLNFKGRVVALARLHPHEEIEKLKAEFSTKPPVDIFLRAEGGGSIVKNVLGKDESWKREEQGGRIRYSTTKDDLEIVVIVEGENVTAGFPRTFIEECLTRKDGLAQSAAFKQALSETASKGQSICYVTPRVITELRGFMSGGMLAGLPMVGFSSLQNRLAMSRMLDSIPVPTKPVTTVIVARPDGLLVRERSVQSLKATLPVMALLTPDFLGQILRVGAQTYAAQDADERAGEIIHQKISGDLDKARTIAGKYFAAHPEEGEVHLSHLREEMAEEKLPALTDVEGDVTFSRASDQISFDLKNGKNITHIFKLTPEQRKTIEGTLKQLAEASVEYLLAGNSYVSISTLVDNGYMPKPEPLVGEDYDQVTLSLDAPTLTVKTPGEQEISYTRDPAAVIQVRRRQAERQIAVEHNLAKIYAAARKYFETTPDESSVSFEQLAQRELVADIKPAAGEDYAHELSSISKDDTKLSITSPRAGTVTWVRPLDEAIQADLTKRLGEIERAAAQYFAKNPKAEVVVSGELLPPPEVKEAKQVETESSESTEKKQPDLTALVIRRDYKSLRITVENDQVIEVPRTRAK